MHKNSMPPIHSPHLAQEFTHIFEVISQPEFLNKEALGGEVPFFISTYHPQDELEAQKSIGAIMRKLRNAGIQVLEFQLYDLCLDILEKRGLLTKILEKESQMDKGRFFKVIQGPLDIESRLIPEIEDRYRQDNPQIVFITGVGQVFPFIRSHVILNNLQRVISEVPTVLFFPGTYDGTKLELFGKMKDDNYYRAFLLNNYKKSS